LFKGSVDFILPNPVCPLASAPVMKTGKAGAEYEGCGIGDYPVRIK
jgi:hypothetical protein